MQKSIIENICSDMFDRLTIIKGYLLLNTERKRVDYTPLILREVHEMEGLVRDVIDILKKLINADFKYPDFVQGFVKPIQKQEQLLNLS